MSDSHKGSKLLLSNTIVPVDKNTTFLAHYDITANDVLRGIEPISNPVYTLRRQDGKFGGGIAIEESTTNLIPGGTTNIYPSVGNQWGTYQTNQYNNGSYFSIGTITNVSNNIVTYSGGTQLRTYDVVRPQTTGGGLTAGVDYFIKAISPTQFTVHTYDNSEDGSKGFSVHDTIKNDIRIPINATNFPTMWWGAPHLPNSDIIKELQYKGFSSYGDPHDYLRIYTNFRNDGVAGGMAYGVYPNVTSGNQYTISFYQRAVDQYSIGKSVTFQTWTNGTWISQGFTLSSDWQKISLTGTPSNSGSTNFYWFPTYNTVWDLSEVQIEQKSFATSLVNGTRSNGLLYYPDNIIDVNKGTFSCWAKTTPMTIDRHIFFQWDTTGEGTSHFGLKMNPNGTVAFWYGMTIITSSQSYDDGNFHHYAVVWESGTTNISLFVDGLRVATVSSAVTIQNSGGRHNNRFPIGHRGWTYNDLLWNGVIDEVRIDSTPRTDEEIQSWYISNQPFYPKGIYRLAY